MLIVRRNMEVRGRQFPAWSAPWLAVKVWVGRDRLDRELAEGSTPDTDPARRLRASQLSNRRGRRHLVTRLRWLVAEARRPMQSTWAMVPPLNLRGIEEGRESLLMLADRLEHAREPCLRALALASLLIHDHVSPAFVPSREPGLSPSNDRSATVANHARVALEGIDRK